LNHTHAHRCASNTDAIYARYYAVFTRQHNLLIDAFVRLDDKVWVDGCVEQILFSFSPHTMSQHVYTITPQAYTKMVLHAAAYPTASVNGVLLATSSSVAKGENIEVVDAVPLLHARLVLSPMLEVALEQASHICASMDVN
jgi:hypothetical protein